MKLIFITSSKNAPDLYEQPAPSEPLRAEREDDPKEDVLREIGEDAMKDLCGD